MYIKINSGTIHWAFKILKLNIQSYLLTFPPQITKANFSVQPCVSTSPLFRAVVIFFSPKVSDQRLSGKSTLLDHQSEGFTSTKSYGLKCSTSVLIAKGLIVNCRYCWELSMHWTLEKAPSLKLKCSCLFQCRKWVNLTKKPPLRLHERLKTTSFQCFVLQ